MKKSININTVLIGLVLILSLGLFIKQKVDIEDKKSESTSSNSQSSSVSSSVSKYNTAAVHFDNSDEVIRIELDKDGEYPITGGKLPVTLAVKDGAISFVNSQCPDHICEGTGFISREGRTAICMPAGVAVIIE